MKLLNSLSVITLLSIVYTIPQHNHSDTTENSSTSSEVASTPFEPANTPIEIISTLAEPISSSGEATSPPAEAIISSESEEVKPEDRFLGLGIPGGLINANVDVAGVGRVKADVLGQGGIANAKADVLGIDASVNVGGNGYHYPPYYPPYYTYYPSLSPLRRNPTQPSKLSKPPQPSKPLKLSKPPKPFYPPFFDPYDLS